MRRRTRQRSPLWSCASTTAPVRPPGERSGRGALLVVLVLVVVAVAALWVVARGGRRGVVVTSGTGTAVSRSQAPAQGSGAGDTSALFDGCPVDGDGGDRRLNRLKNRERAGVPTDVALESLLTLPWPAGVDGRTRGRWPAGAAAGVAASERRYVRSEGYVAMARTSGPESTNCHGDEPRYRDFHVWITAQPTAERARSVIVEMTPRMRARHAGWTVRRLNEVARRHERVRVTGWLLLDQEHPEQIGRTRGTLWEIHPVIAFEVRRGGRWVALDSLADRGGRR